MSTVLLIARSPNLYTFHAVYPRGLASLDGPLLPFVRLAPLATRLPPDMLAKQVQSRPYTPIELPAPVEPVEPVEGEDQVLEPVREWWQTATALNLALCTQSEGVVPDRLRCLVLQAFSYETAVLTISKDDFEATMAQWLGRDDADALRLLVDMHTALQAPKVPRSRFHLPFPAQADDLEASKEFLMKEVEVVSLDEYAFIAQDRKITLSWHKLLEFLVCGGRMHAAVHGIQASSVSILQALRLALRAWEHGDMRMFEQSAIELKVHGSAWMNSRLPLNWLQFSKVLQSGKLEYARQRLVQAMQGLEGDRFMPAGVAEGDGGRDLEGAEAPAAVEEPVETATKRRRGLKALETIDLPDATGDDPTRGVVAVAAEEVVAPRGPVGRVKKAPAE